MIRYVKASNRVEVTRDEMHDVFAMRAGTDTPEKVKAWRDWLFDHMQSGVVELRAHLDGGGSTEIKIVYGSGIDGALTPEETRAGGWQ